MVYYNTNTVNPILSDKRYLCIGTIVSIVTLSTTETVKETKMTTNYRFKATYRGEVLGWYDTAKEAELAIEVAEEEEKNEEKEWYLQQSA